MGSGQSFYNYGYGSLDLTKTILLMKPLKEVDKFNNNKIASVENSSAKKTSFGATTSSVVMILGKNILYMKPLKEIEET